MSAGLWPGVVASQSTGPGPLTGGTVYSDATYYYNVFTANGDLVVPAGLTIDVEVLVVGGGGCGGA